jgi:hypothetical protein
MRHVLVWHVARCSWRTGRTSNSPASSIRECVLSAVPLLNSRWSLVNATSSTSSSWIEH